MHFVDTRRSSAPIISERRPRSLSSTLQTWPDILPVASFGIALLNMFDCINWSIITGTSDNTSIECHDMSSRRSGRLFRQEVSGHAVQSSIIRTFTLIHLLHNTISYQYHLTSTSLHWLNHRSTRLFFLVHSIQYHIIT